MKLRHLKVSNFRGIKELDWNICGDLICLIGPGDSTKTTILDAIEYVLSPRWNISFSDLDFCQSDTTKPIIIIATVTGLSKKLIKEEKFGLYLNFWNLADGVHESEKDGDETALVVQLTIDSSLEPQWVVINNQTGEQKLISAADRQEMGVSQIGNYIERDLSWGRGSALTRLTGREKIEDIPAILADASRIARAALKNADLKQLSTSATQLEIAAKRLGVTPRTGFKPGMDPLNINVNLGAITLMDGEIPLRACGLGSRRLLVLTIHQNSSKEGAILLVDEVENGLEPYRLRNLLRFLKPDSGMACQTILTTHSPISIVELKAEELHVVHANNGNISVHPIDSSLQDIVRNIPEAFLARSIIVCEGKTEWGLCRSLEDYWQVQKREPFAFCGVEPIYSSRGGGTEAPNYAYHLATLGFRVAYFGDSDTPLQPSQNDLEKCGVKVILWKDGLEIERRLTQDLPWEGLESMINLAVQLEDNDLKVWDLIQAKLDWKSKDFPRNLSELRKIKPESEIRNVLGLAANAGKWFKRPDKGQALGKIVTAFLEQIPGTDTFTKIKELESWIYA